MSIHPSEATEYPFLITYESENCTLPLYYVASSGNILPTFRDNLSVPVLEVKNILYFENAAETSVWNYHFITIYFVYFNPFNAELNPICHLPPLLGAHHILHVSRIRVKIVYRQGWRYTILKYMK